MTVSENAGVYAIATGTPALHPTSFVAPGARVVGAVTVGESSSIWYNAVVRADSASVTIGARSNLQDNVSVHVDPTSPVVIGDDVSVGHNAVVHGCTIEDGSLVGMGAVILNGAVIGAGSLIAGGAVVLEGAVIPPGSLVAGVPAKVRRELSEQERAGLLRNAAVYLAHTQTHRAAEGI